MTHCRQFSAGQFLNVFYHYLLVAGAKRKGSSRMSCAAGAPDAVYVGFGYVGQIVVDYQVEFPI